MLWRQRNKVLLTFVVAMLATAYHTATSPQEFESEAKLQVQIGRESMALDPTATIGPYVGLTDTRETEIQAFEELLLSKTVIGKVVEKIGIDQLLGPPKWFNSGEVPWLEIVPRPDSTIDGLVASFDAMPRDRRRAFKSHAAPPTPHSHPQ